MHIYQFPTSAIKNEMGKVVFTDEIFGEKIAG